MEASDFDPHGLDPALHSLLAFWSDAGVDLPRPPAAPPAAPPRASGPASPTPPPPLPARPSSPARTTAALGPEVARARGAALAAPDLAALAAAVGAFETPLKPRGARVVFSRGTTERPAVAAIVQGPSPNDEAEGLPGAGRAGRLLDRMLAAAGLEDRALVLATAFWRPGPRAGAAEVEAVCAPFLERALALARPRALLLVGEGALRALTGPGEPILAARGKWLAWTPADAADIEPIPALPMFSPDFLLKQPAAKKRAWADLLALAARLAAA